MMKKFIAFLSTLGIMSTMVMPTALGLSPVALPFTDVHYGDTYVDGIVFLEGEDIIDGYPDGTYKPSQTLNRAEMLKIVAEGKATLEGLEMDVFDEYADDECFADVPANEWFTKYVCYAKAEGWVVGYEGNEFRPAQTVTFVEGLKMTLEGLAISYEETPDTWYKGPVDAAAMENYIPYTIMSFDSGLQRDEMADMIARVIMDEEGMLASYLGDREEMVVTFETITDGEDVSEMVVEEEPLPAVPVSYDVTIMNSSDQQEAVTMPFAPAVVVAHACDASLFAVETMAAAEWEALAEVGDPSAVVTANEGMYYVVTTEGVTLPGESQTVTVEVPGDATDMCVTVAAMAVGSNDGVVLATAMLDMEMELSADGMVYDMGFEENSDLNSGFDGGQPDGTRGEENLDNGTATDPQGDVMAHPQFDGFDPIMSITTMMHMMEMPAEPMTYDVEITSEGFSPAELTIAAGDTVRFTNMDETAHWPASDVHPTHGDYPEEGGCIGSMFDACEGLEMDGTYEFMFNEVGDWDYHDHLVPALTGMITVE